MTITNQATQWASNKKTLKQVLIHWYHVNKIFIKYFGFKNYIFSECYKHDLDKIIPVLLGKYSKEKHRLSSNHHIANVVKKGTIYDCMEMLSDWESARFTKATKQLSANEYWLTIKHKYNNKTIEELLKTFN